MRVRAIHKGYRPLINRLGRAEQFFTRETSKAMVNAMAITGRHIVSRAPGSLKYGVRTDPVRVRPGEVIGRVFMEGWKVVWVNYGTASRGSGGPFAPGYSASGSPYPIVPIHAKALSWLVHSITGKTVKGANYGFTNRVVVAFVENHPGMKGSRFFDRAVSAAQRAIFTQFSRANDRIGRAIMGRQRRSAGP